MGLRGRKLLFLCLGLFLINPVCAVEDFSEYMDGVRRKIQKSWCPPECLEKDGHALIKFSITRQGDIYAAQILESSGDKFYDASAIEALKKAAPFDNFPAATARGSLTINYSFDTEVVNTGNMQKHLAEAKKYYNVNNHLALYHITNAIKEVEGDINSYFLYGKRSKIKAALGDEDGAQADMEESKRLKAKYDKKRIMASRVYAEMEQSPYAYFALANSYDIAGDYENAIKAIDKAIGMTDLNNQYKRYRVELIQKKETL